jgi:uncharacterized protein YjbI with pentapeptide repeats
MMRTCLKNADARDARMMAAQLIDADLSNANLQGAWLNAANLRSANLECANLSDADLRLSILTNVRWDGAIVNRIRMSRGAQQHLDLAVIKGGDSIEWYD